MAIKTRTQLKALFENGDTPSASDFADLIDSLYCKAEDPISTSQLVYWDAYTGPYFYSELVVCEEARVFTFAVNIEPWSTSGSILVRDSGGSVIDRVQFVAGQNSVMALSLGPGTYTFEANTGANTTQGRLSRFSITSTLY